MLEQAAPAALASLPSWATGEKKAGDNNNLEEDSAQAARGAGSDYSGEGDRSATTSAAGSLAQELRQKVFELEAQVSELQGNLSEAREMMRGVGIGAANRDGESMYCTSSSA